MFIPFFMESNKITFFSDIRKVSRHKAALGLHTKGTHSFNIFTKISSCPWALCGLRLLISWKITSEETLRESVISQVIQRRSKCAAIVDCSALLAGKIFVKYVSLSFKVSCLLTVNQQGRDVRYLSPMLYIKLSL